MRILVVCIFIHQFASLTVLRRRHSVVSDKRETTLGRQLFYCASGNTRSLNFKLKCADVAAHTLKNVVSLMLSSIIKMFRHVISFQLHNRGCPHDGVIVIKNKT
jgi:hypothetical protein